MTTNAVTSLESAKTIFMLGIAGTGMRGLAYLLAAQGKTIAGSDSQFAASEDIPGIALIPKENLVRETDAGEHLSRADLVIYTDAMPTGHRLLQEARAAGVPLLSYPEALGEFARDFTTVAVAGTHGKSSTAAFLAHIMIDQGLDPTILIGASMPSLPGGHARLGSGEYFVVEADEYREHFLALAPAHAIITNIDFDHPDFFASQEAVEDLFKKFIGQVKGEVVSDAHGDANLLMHANDTNTTTAIADVPAPLPGGHMRGNAELAVKMAEKLGIARDKAIDSLGSFPGLSRRFEEIGRLNNMVIVSDYGHHPREISATLQAAQEKFAGKRIAVLLEPHMNERLEVFAEEFSAALGGAEFVLIYPVFTPSGREKTTGSAHTEGLLERLHAQGTAAELVTHRDQLGAHLKSIDKEFSLLLAFSAGKLDSDLRAFLRTI